MAVAVTLDIFGETEQRYEQVIAAFFPDGKLPDGWLVRLAGRAENGSPGVRVRFGLGGDRAAVAPGRIGTFTSDVAKSDRYSAGNRRARPVRGIVGHEQRFNGGNRDERSNRTARDTHTAGRAAGGSMARALE